ncbi:hypothetical protein CYMTET_25278 [Cymbomonas tetramitiformis]|uniref:Uncharacterized protein n=1 Tax=Cymbomonas tetramitiformis TaxID=36881 RepID=A0AAE0KZC5_9CHLO|nr:hypothetical protein CYMTET_25278 [Cymbomonas tetramitiformis]
MVGNYSSKAQAFKQFSVAEGRWWLPTTEATVQATNEQGEELTVRTWLPARQVSMVNAHGLELHPLGRAKTELLRACTYVLFAFVTFDMTDTRVSMLKIHIRVSGPDGALAALGADTGCALGAGPGGGLPRAVQLPEAVVGARQGPIGSSQ